MSRWMGRGGRHEASGSAPGADASRAGTGGDPLLALSPRKRGLLPCFLLFAGTAFAWAWIASVDVVASARGRLLLPEGAQRVQSRHPGTILSLHVEDGMHVEAGELVIQLDATGVQADLERAERRRMEAEVEAARLEAALTGADLREPARADPDRVAASIDLLRRERGALRAKLDAAEKKGQSLRSERDAANASVERLLAGLPIAEKRSQAVSYLEARGVASEFDALEAEQELVSVRHEIEIARALAAQKSLELERLEEEKRQISAEYEARWTADLLAARAEASDLDLQIVKLNSTRDALGIRAPVSGQVQELAVHTVGGVVAPASPLMTIVPVAEEIEAEVFVANSEIAFVERGQRATVKLDAFPFTRFGSVTGTVRTISRDVVPGLDPAAPPELFAVRVQLDQTRWRTGDSAANLRSGMTLVADITTGRRTVLDYVLSPLLRYADESLRER